MIGLVPGRWAINGFAVIGLVSVLGLILCAAAAAAVALQVPDQPPESVSRWSPPAMPAVHPSWVRPPVDPPDVPPAVEPAPVQPRVVRPCAVQRRVVYSRGWVRGQPVRNVLRVAVRPFRWLFGRR